VFNSDEVKDKDSLEARFKRCKEGVAGMNSSKSYAICSYLNPRIPAKRRKQLKNRMINKRKK
jgi:hypothetical protein